jgi:hypothetical protein
MVQAPLRSLANVRPGRAKTTASDLSRCIPFRRVVSSEKKPALFLMASEAGVGIASLEAPAGGLATAAGVRRSENSLGNPARVFALSYGRWAGRPHRPLIHETPRRLPPSRGDSQWTVSNKHLVPHRIAPHSLEYLLRCVSGGI